MNSSERIPDGALAHTLVGLEIGEQATFSFVWDGVEYSESATVVSHELRESEIRPDDAPEPIDVDLETKSGVAYRFTVVTLEGEPVPIGDPGTFERRGTDDDRFTQLPDATVLTFEEGDDE